MLCPECNDQLSIDYTPEFNANRPWEIVCYGCGWFHPDRFATKKEAGALGAKQPVVDESTQQTLF